MLNALRARLQRRHWLALGALVACAAAYAANIAFAEVRPGSTWGLSYGIAAGLLLAVAGAYGLRRRSMKTASRLGAGSASGWLTVHVYGGGLFLLLVLMHSGFALPDGWITWWLWGLSLWTVAGGLLGLALQRWIPRLLTSGLSVEAHYDRIPELTADIAERAAKLAADSPPAIRGVYDRVVAPELDAPRRRPLYFFDITGGIHDKLKEFRYLSTFLSDDDRRSLEELETLYRTKLELDAHYTLQHPLRWWLYAHLPVSILLVGFVLLHLISVFLY
jgi:hypothetical protein